MVLSVCPIYLSMSLSVVISILSLLSLLSWQELLSFAELLSLQELNLIPGKILFHSSGLKIHQYVYHIRFIRLKISVLRNSLLPNSLICTWYFQLCFYMCRGCNISYCLHSCLFYSKTIIKGFYIAINEYVNLYLYSIPPLNAQ